MPVEENNWTCLVMKEESFIWFERIMVAFLSQFVIQLDNWIYLSTACLLDPF